MSFIARTTLRARLGVAAARPRIAAGGHRVPVMRAARMYSSEAPKQHSSDLPWYADFFFVVVVVVL